MNSIKLYIKFLFLLSLIIVTGCKRDDFIGAEYVVAPADLKIVSFGATGDTFNLLKEPVTFSGKLSHRVTWIIKLRGVYSGAVKDITGLSDTISPLDSRWNGNHTGLYFFRKGEPIIAQLTFLKSGLTKSDTFFLSQTKSYEGITLFKKGFEYDKDDGSPIPFDADTSEGVNGAVSIAFPEAGQANAIQKLDSFNTVQGHFSYYLQGVDNNKNYFINGVRQYFEDGQGYFKFPAGTNSENLYFNFYVYGTGRGTTRAAIACAEDDNSDSVYVDAGSGEFFKDAGNKSEDVWEYPFKVTWTGWKLISVKYSDFSRSVSPDYGGTGNGLRQIDRIKKITFNCLSDPPGGSAEYYVDFPIITFGKPFNPNE